jgi:nucleoid-associated protein YgaU
MPPAKTSDQAAANPERVKDAQPDSSSTQNLTGNLRLHSSLADEVTQEQRRENQKTLSTEASPDTPLTKLNQDKSAASAKTQNPTYTVQKHDTYYAIAGKILGDSSRWREIQNLNPKIKPKNLKPGQILTLPKKGKTFAAADNRSTKTTGKPAKDSTYTVQKHDTYYAIAEKILGNPSRWREIQDLNPKIKPKNLKPGQVLKMPTQKQSKDQKENVSGKTYTIKRGDTLESISKALYGSRRHWKIIADANSLDPKKLKPGSIIKIPELQQSASAKKPDQSTEKKAAGLSGPQALAQAVFDKLGKTGRGALRSKVLDLRSDPKLDLNAVLISLAKKHQISLTIEGLKAFQKKRGLTVDGKIGLKTASAISQVISAQWYKDLAAKHKHIWRSQTNQVNIIGLRGWDLTNGAHTNPHNRWNDTIALVWKDKNGRMQVREFKATTDPGVKSTAAPPKGSPDVNKDGRGDPAWVKTGQYPMKIGSYKGQADAVRPVSEPIAVHRDFNNDGKISGTELKGKIPIKDKKGKVSSTGQEASKLTADGIRIHWGRPIGKQPTHPGRYSTGCQVIRANRKDFRNQFTSVLKLDPGRNKKEMLYTLIDLSKKSTK